MACRPQSLNKTDNTVHTHHRSRSHANRSSATVTCHKNNGNHGGNSNHMNQQQAPWIGLLKRFRPQATSSSVVNQCNSSGLCSGNINRNIIHKASTAADPTHRLAAATGSKASGNTKHKNQASCSRYDVCGNISKEGVNNIYRRPRSRSSGGYNAQFGNSGSGTRVCFSPTSVSCDIRGLISPCDAVVAGRRRAMFSDKRAESLQGHQDYPGDSESCACDAANVSEATHSKSILRKRMRSSSVPAIGSNAQVHIKDTGAKSKGAKPTLQKQTSFMEDVQVIYYCEEEQANSNLARQSEKLKDGDQLEVHYSENYLDINKNCLTDDEPESNKEGTNTDQSHQSSTKSCTESDTVNSTVNNAKTKLADENTNQQTAKMTTTGKDQVVVEHDSCELQSVITKTSKGIRLEVEIDSKCLVNRTCVKAMSGGRTIIVMTYRLEGQGHTELHQYVDKINLPVMVNPYAVKAQVKQNGHLCIEAPFK